MSYPEMHRNKMRDHNEDYWVPSYRQIERRRQRRIAWASAVVGLLMVLSVGTVIVVEIVRWWP